VINNRPTTNQPLQQLIFTLFKPNAKLFKRRKWKRPLNAFLHLQNRTLGTNEKNIINP
jgi:hypothetical protein